MFPSQQDSKYRKSERKIGTKKERQAMTADKSRRIKAHSLRFGVSIPCLASFSIDALECQISDGTEDCTRSVKLDADSP